MGVDGIVYSDRTPQTDYWLVRKAYSPVQIKVREIAVQPGAQNISFQVENRFDFRTLGGIDLKWSLRKNGAMLQDGVVALQAKSRQSEDVSLPVKLPMDLKHDVFTLELRCVDKGDRQFYERSIRLNTGAPENARWSTVLAALPSAEPKLEISESVIVVSLPNYRLNLDRRSGQLSLLSTNGVPIISAVGPHTGRHPTINDVAKNRTRERELWQGSLLNEVSDLKTDAHQLPNGIELSVSGNYPRPGKSEESVRGGYTLLITRDGAIEVNYSYKPSGATGEMLEAGFALALPKAESEFRWIGQGPYAGYPGKDRLNEYGIFHLSRDDLYFPGNRREVELASLAAPSGVGVLLGGNSMAIDVENKGDVTILSHLALVPGERSNSESGENVDVSSRLNAARVKEISGKFRLLPLEKDWPKPLKEWFGSTSKRVEVKQPFLWSYDQ